MGKRLYVGNLPYSATEADLFDAFKAFNPESARIIEGRGFGFIEVTDDLADEAIAALHDKELGGRRIVVNEARPRPEGTGGGGSRPSYGGGGGGGGGGFRSGGGGGGGGSRGGGGRPSDRRSGGGGRW